MPTPGSTDAAGDQGPSGGTDRLRASGLGTRLAGLDRRWGVVAVAWVAACLATAGSLYYSNGLGLYPCRLCWFQRILMYPLTVVLGVALFHPGQDLAVGRFVLPLSVPGVAIAAYHSFLQLTPSATCSLGACSAVQFRLFGLLSIPNQSLVAFLVVTACLGWVTWRT